MPAALPRSPAAGNVAGMNAIMRVGRWHLVLGTLSLLLSVSCERRAPSALSRAGIADGGVSDGGANEDAATTDDVPPDMATGCAVSGGGSSATRFGALSVLALGGLV